MSSRQYKSLRGRDTIEDSGGGGGGAEKTFTNCTPDQSRGEVRLQPCVLYFCQRGIILHLSLELKLGKFSLCQTAYAALFNPRKRKSLSWELSFIGADWVHSGNGTLRWEVRLCEVIWGYVRTEQGGSVWSHSLLGSDWSDSSLDWRLQILRREQAHPLTGTVIPPLPPTQQQSQSQTDTSSSGHTNITFTVTRPPSIKRPGLNTVAGGSNIFL